MQICPNAVLYKHLPQLQHDLMSSYFYYVPCHIFVLSQVPFTSLSGSFCSSPKWANSPSSPEAPICNSSHYYPPPLQRVPWKSRIRRIPSIMPSLRTQKLGSRWQTPKHSWTDLVGMPTTPLLASTETSLPSWSFRFPWCSFCVRRYFWMRLESGSISHGSWVVGHLGQHGKDSVRWMAVSLTPYPISHP